MQLNNKKIILTGASSGIGAQLLKYLLSYDIEIIIGDLAPEKITPIADNIYPTYCDVSKTKDIDQLFDYAIKKLGHIDIFIANAGFAYYEKIQQENWSHIDKIYQTNTISPIYTTTKMARINQGKEYCVVITASAMAKQPLPGYALYASTKAALDSFAAAFRYEQNHGHLLLVYPIATKTNFFTTASSKTTPIPWPSQTAEIVAQSIIKGIKQNKKSIYPSLLFRFIEITNRILPFVLTLYAKVEQFKFRRWFKSSDHIR